MADDNSGGAGGAPAGNGLIAFDLHTMDEATAPMLTRMGEERDLMPSFAGPVPVEDESPETAARRYVDQALHSDAAPGFTAPPAAGGTTDFLRLGVETIAVTETVIVKFRQAFNRIPVYGSLVSVELDGANNLLALHSNLGDPDGLSPIAKVAPAEAVALVKAHPAHKADPAGITPQLSYWYDQRRSRWHLAYILENVPVAPAGRARAGAASGGRGGRPSPLEVVDYVVDAHRARVLATLPRTAEVAVTETGADAWGVTRTFNADKTATDVVLFDTVANIRTHDFGFGDPAMNGAALPGPLVAKTAAGWDPAGVSAHANAALVAAFLRDELKRANIDGRGGPLVSTVNCVVAAASSRPREWLNAFWSPRYQQMVYGQALMADGTTRSLAANVDVVGHEMMHGVTDRTARLEYALQSGALNESYSDIFGTLIANRDVADIDDWNWELGERILSNDRPLRDLRTPSRFNQPEHMRNYRVLPNTPNGDYGGVHINSGIHNKAAYLMLTTGTRARPTLTPHEVAILFYVALTQYLSRTSQFGDSRRAVLGVARSLFRSLSRPERAAKIRVIEDSFAAVGIV